MEPPIILIDHGTLAVVFDDIETVETHIEAYDVDAFEAYDSTARRLVISPRPNDTVVLTETEPAARDEARVRETIVAALRHVGEPVDAAAPLPALVSLAREHFLFPSASTGRSILRKIWRRVFRQRAPQ